MGRAGINAHSGDDGSGVDGEVLGERFVKAVITTDEKASLRNQL